MDEKGQPIGGASMPLHEGDAEAQIVHLPTCEQKVLSYCAREVDEKKAILAIPIEGSEAWISVRIAK
jgi:hypothetical protein